MHGPTNPPVELARYTAAGQQRIVRGQRVLGVVRITDVPADRDHGRCYLIERDLTCMREIDAIIADYLRQAQLLDTVPASSGLLAREIAALAS